MEVVISPASPFECAGLREANPRDFLAALGLLKLLHLRHSSARVTLSWTMSGHPVFHSHDTLPENWSNFLVDELRAINSANPHPFVHNKVIKVPHAEFRSAIRRALAFQNQDVPFSALPSALYAAFGSQVHDKEKDES